MEEFKVGDKVACYVQNGGYARHWENPETIVRETKCYWVTDEGTQIRKDNHEPKGYTDLYTSREYRLWTTEMEIKKQRRLLRKALEEEIISALKEHSLNVNQLQYIKTMIDENKSK